MQCYEGRQEREDTSELVILSINESYKSNRQFGLKTILIIF